MDLKCFDMKILITQIKNEAVSFNIFLYDRMKLVTFKKSSTLSPFWTLVFVLNPEY